MESGSGRDSNWSKLTKEAKEFLIWEAISEMVRVSKNKRMLILVTNGYLELFVNGLIELKLKNSKKINEDSRGYPYSTRLLILNEMGLLSDTQYKELDWYRKIRNKAAHMPVFKMVKNDFASLPNEIFKKRRALLPLSIALIGEFWNQHATSLGVRKIHAEITDNKDGKTAEVQLEWSKRLG